MGKILQQTPGLPSTPTRCIVIGHGTDMGMDLADGRATLYLSQPCCTSDTRYHGRPLLPVIAVQLPTSVLLRSTATFVPRVGLSMGNLVRAQEWYLPSLGSLRDVLSLRYQSVQLCHRSWSTINFLCSVSVFYTAHILGVTLDTILGRSFVAIWNPLFKHYCFLSVRSHARPLTAPYNVTLSSSRRQRCSLSPLDLT